MRADLLPDFEQSRARMGKAALRAAGASAPARSSATRQKQHLLTAVFSVVEPETRSYPGIVKIAMFAAGVAASWALVIVGVKLLARG